MADFSISLPLSFYRVRIQLINPQLGTIAKSQGVVDKWIESGKIKHQLKYENLTDDEMQEVESKAVLEAEDKSWTGFSQSVDLSPDDPNFGKHFIYNYMIKGNLRYAAGVFNGSSYEKDGKKKDFPNNFKSKVTNAVFVGPRRVYLPLREDMDLEPHKDENGKETGFMKVSNTLERPLRCGGFPERTALARSDYLPAGAELEFQIRLIGITGTNKVSEEHLQALLYYGQYNGLGQWRNAGFGAYVVTEFEKIDPADALEIDTYGGGVI